MAEPVSLEFVSLIKLMPEIEAEYAIDVIGGSESMYEGILKRIVRLIPSNIEQMDLFIGAGNDLHNFEVKAHGIKSSLRQAGYMRLAQRAEELEYAAKDGNKPYCEEHYVSFRQEILCFHDKIDAVASQCEAAEDSTDAENLCCENIRDYFDVLEKVINAAEAYDSMSASELLIPLKKRRFEGNAGTLIANALEALDIFKPRKALEYLKELKD